MVHAIDKGEILVDVAGSAPMIDCVIYKILICESDN